MATAIHRVLGTVAFRLQHLLPALTHSRVVRRSFSTDFAHDEYRRMQAIVAGSSDHHQGIYNELEVRTWLSQFQGGNVELEIGKSDGVAVITLVNEAARNAMTGSMMVQLSEKVSELEKWREGRAVVLRGSGSNFCSGGDLKNFISKIADPVSGTKMSIFMQNVTTRLAMLPLISVALLEGHTLGGGAELAMCCDLRLMTPGATMGFVQGKLGVTTGWGGCSALARKTDYANALRCLTSGHRYTAKEAERFKLIDFVLGSAEEENVKIDSKKALEMCDTWLKKHVLQCKPVATRAYKHLLMSIYASETTEKYLRIEREHFSRLWGGPAHIDAMKDAFKK